MSDSSQEHSGDFIPVTTDEGRLRQLVDYLEEHVSSFSDVPSTEPPEGASAAEVQEAREALNDALARRDDAVVHAAMLVLGAAVNHTLPMVAYVRPETSWEDIVLGENLTTATVFTPSEPTGACVVALHGGPWWAGDGVARENVFSPDCAALAERSGAVVVDVDYRLAPEHSLPDAVADINAALSWTRGQAGIDTDKIVLWANDASAETALTAVGEGEEVALLALTNPVTGGSVFDRSVASGNLAQGGALSLYVQSGSHDTVAVDVPELVAAAENAEIPVSTDSYLATHDVIPPAERRRRLTDLARTILEATGTEREIAPDAVGDYDKEAIDRGNEESWGTGVMPDIPDRLK